jgi:hypothetical protein
MLCATLGTKATANRKTGRMFQTYILRSDMDPIKAAQTKADAAICGSCPHKLKENGTCYVRLDTGPLQVYKAWQRGNYPTLTLAQSREVFAGQLVRMGSYGDPCAVPFEVWRTIMAKGKGHTGYTHAWKEPRFAPFATLCMASCDNVLEGMEARGLGWRAFTILPKGAIAVPGGSFLCPASEEGGKKLTCGECLACDGNASNRRASIHIPVHGVSFKVQRFNNLITIGGAA